MVNKYVRFLVVAAVLCIVMGLHVPLVEAESVPVLGELIAQPGHDGPVIRISTEGELDTVYYSPQPGVWVVEMPEASWAEAEGFLAAPEIGIERAELAHVEEFGKSLSRLTVWMAQPARLELNATEDEIELQFVGVSLGKATQDDVQSSDLPAHLVAARENGVTSVQAVNEDARVEIPPVITEPINPSSDQQVAATQQDAESLFEVTPTSAGQNVIIDLRGDGPLVGEAFTLPSPNRLVVDFHGVVNRVDKSLFSVGSHGVRQVRLAQFRGYPDPITRMVVDLGDNVEHELSQTPNGAKLVIGPDTVSFAPAMVEDASVEVATLPGNTGVISIERSRNSSPVADFETDHDADQADAQVTEQAPIETETGTVVEQPESRSARSPFVADKSQLIERAPAAEMLNTASGNADSFVVTEVETEEQQFTGEPITLTLKDADIKDVLRTFSELTQLNIVLDPGVSGAVTVELRDVPWDQALDLILRINDLDYVLENNVLRVAPIDKLAREKQNKAAYLVDEEMSQPLKTVLKPVSYARATYIANLLVSDSYLMSNRGTVTVDDRTNTLIIRDIVDRVEGILRLIDSLDQPTPQVVIEGRIVETTKDFSHELGMNWGFSGSMDAEHGNDTGLSFPNSITSDGGVELQTGGAHYIGFTFADILDTFNLDFQLRAAESDNKVTIVSTPRVTTQNLTSASIRSGLQIPVQTVSNNTVTVTYVDATLRLQVTPQITAEGTVNLTLNVNKREAILAGVIAGATNAPIFTREAQTQLLVRDGGTTVIAGIYVINDQDSEDSVPGLSKIPIVKHLFKNKSIFKRHDELLIFITPRIVKY